jgi:hypothetical protein
MNFLKRLLRGKIEQTKEEVKDWADPNREEVPMPCPEITIEGIDGVLYGKLLHQAVQSEATFVGLNVHFQGVSLDWNYDEPSQTLHITCTKKPFYASCELVESKLRELVAKAKGAV